MTKQKIAVVGIGKIAIDQHLPVIDKSGDFEVAATVSGRMIQHRDLPVFKTTAELYQQMPEVELVAICTPPSVRHGLVREALDAGKHVLMEKPPTPTISEFFDLVAYGKQKNRVLFQTWHSRYNKAVDAARDILRNEGVRFARIDWRENVRKWHPGQDWVWEPGGFGVFDPGINALSILTKILPFPVFVDTATLSFPANRQTPVDVKLRFKSAQPSKPDLSAGFNWLEESGEIWTISLETTLGKVLKLEKGGTVLRVDGYVEVENSSEEYEGIYTHFAELLRTGMSDVTGEPLQIVADAYLLGRRITVDAFDW